MAIMKEKIYTENILEAVRAAEGKGGFLKSLLEVCPLCGKEFSCNKSHHVYTALVNRRRQYYCSYSCYKLRNHHKI